jgi:hypothetical protein
LLASHFLHLLLPPHLLRQQLLLLLLHPHLHLMPLRLHLLLLLLLSLLLLLLPRPSAAVLPPLLTCRPCSPVRSAHTYHTQAPPACLLLLLLLLLCRPHQQPPQ